VQRGRPYRGKEELQRDGVGREVEEQSEPRNDSLRFSAMPTPLDRAQDEKIACIRHRNCRRHLPTGQNELIGARSATRDLGAEVLVLDPRPQDACDRVENLVARRRTTDPAHVAEQIVF
jgi:hypothetical protein